MTNDSISGASHRALHGQFLGRMAPPGRVAINPAPHTSQSPGKAEQRRRPEASRAGRCPDAGPVPAILSAQQPEGYWFTRRNFYSPKYRSTHCSMVLLTEMGVDHSEVRFSKGAEEMLSITQSAPDSHITMGKAKEACFWGNVLRYTARAGPLDDPRIAAVLSNLVSKGLDDHWVCPHFGDSCIWGVLRALW
ncbi:hypothetical protein KAJ02_02460 [Candidatus Bipolaricaulota bacterium]|nr:hypothetical protein [Candidatus Bipolaricaulota bacterium]